TKYELVGFTGFDGRSVYPVIKQSTIINPQFATKEEIDSYMTSLGFDKIEDWVFSNGDLRISDLRPRNVLKDADGDIYVVDAEIRRIKPKFSLQGGRAIADKYEKKVNTKGKGGAMHLSKFNFMEATQDGERALKEVQRIIEQDYGIVLESYEDAYMAENAMSSIAKASWDRYINEVFWCIKKV
ncbi:MAG: hypothetical protein II308_04445, partial [Muribaculaceae bacterium]|nr:hypothetical protein [Muribaculaceae bacterium]